MIENSFKPFKKDPDPDRLFNICTGKSSKKGTEDFLLNVEFIGNEGRKCFIQESVENPNWFGKRIKKKNPVLQQSQGNERFEGLKEKLLKHSEICLVQCRVCQCNKK